MEDIAFVATKGRQLVNDQFRYGIVQDFPVDEGREKEKKIR